MRQTALIGGLMLLAGAAPTQCLSQDQPPPVSDEFVRLFASYCLKSFPDDAALLKQAEADNLAPLSPAEVRTMLHKDSGAGWVIGGAKLQYVLTVEQPPFHTCALRHLSDQPLDGQPLMMAAKSFVEASGHKLMPPVGHSRPMNQGMISNALILQELDEKDQPLPQAYMYFVVSYPAKPREDGSMTKPFYEIRFVRQLYRQQT
jgi:hypothetical protein